MGGTAGCFDLPGYVLLDSSRLCCCRPQGSLASLTVLANPPSQNTASFICLTVVLLMFRSSEVLISLPHTP
eukprot:766976-Hanusia_phi.AAC.15